MLPLFLWKSGNIAIKFEFIWNIICLNTIEMDEFIPAIGSIYIVKKNS